MKMVRRIIVIMLALTLAIMMSGCNLSDALIAAGEALGEEESVSESFESESGEESETEEEMSTTEELANEEETSDTMVNDGTSDEVNADILYEEGQDDDQTANPPIGDVYDYEDGLCASDYLETNYSSYQNCGVFDLGDKQGNVGIAIDEGVTFFFEATQNVQSFSLDLELCAEEIYPLVIIDDINFDGYNDLLIPLCSGTNNIYYHAFLYEDWSGYFVTEPNFAQIENPTVDETNQVITSYGHISAAEYDEILYLWIEPFVIHGKLHRQVRYDADTDLFMVTTIILAVDGRIAYNDTKEYTAEEVSKLPSLVDTMNGL